MLHRMLSTILAVGLLTPGALSQETAPRPGAPGENGVAASQPGARGQGMANWFLRDLDQNVKLTDAQKTQLQGSLDKLRQEAMDQFRNNPPAPQAQETFRNLRQQLQEAAAAGQDAKVDEIQKQMENTGGASMFRQMRTRAMDEVEKVLTVDQKRAFQEWRSLRESRLPAPLLTNPDTFKTTIAGISTLSAVQKATLEAAFERYRRQAEVLGQDDPVTLNAVRNRLMSEVQGVLKPSQQVLLMDSWREQMRARAATQPAGRWNSGGAGGGFGGFAAASPPQVDPQNVDAWTAYVQAFVARYSLDDGQSQQSYAILSELQKRAAEYASSHRMDTDEMNVLSAQATSAEERATIERERKDLNQPVVDVFHELQTRLEAIPTAAQRSATSQPAVASRNRGPRPARSNPAPNTQPSSRP